MIYKKIPKIEDIIILSNIHPSRIFNVTIFGSRVYSTSTETSDWDIIIIANNSVDAIELKCSIDNVDYNIHIHTPDKFKKDLEWHKINNLECIYAPNWAKLKTTIEYNDFKLDKKRLRHATSHISSNSWVKAKKKIDNDYNIALKSLFHSLRILIFSIQLVKNDKIDFSSANFIWDKLIGKYWSWDELENEFKPLRNKLLSEFRSYAKK